MKKLIIAAIAILLYATPTKAQFGVQAGAVGVPGEAFPTADNLDKLGGAAGFTLGVFYQYAVGEKFVFQPAVNLLNKRWKDDLDDGFEVTSMSINYLEIPLQFVYTGGKDKGFFAGAGPSILFGIGGKYKIEGDGVQDFEENYEFNTTKFPEKPLTIGLNAMVGYNFGGLMVGVNYGMGLTNRDVPDNKDFGNESHFALRIGYIFSSGN